MENSANAAYGQSLPYGQPMPGNALTEPTAPDTARMQEELQRHIGELAEIAGHLGKIATELFGPPPPAPIQGEGNPKSQGVMDQIHMQMQHLHWEAAHLAEIAQRFNRLT